MKSRRDSILILCIVLIAAILAGCGAAEQRPALERIEYTNLNDSGSRELLKELLSEIGVSDERMEKYDTSWGQDTASPFIMENDELMDGWRPNPDSRSSALG